jgi:hypothetical protein
MTAPPATRLAQWITVQPTWFGAFELGVKTGKLALTTGVAQRPRERRGPARDRNLVQPESRRAPQRFGWPAGPPVVRGDEAGRDGCGLHRAWGALGGAHVVVESSRREVKRRYRRAKTARLDGDQRRTMLRRSHAGAKQVWSVVHVPRVAEADRWPLPRA